MFAFRAVSLCLAAAPAALPLAPVEHVHRTEGPDGQHLVTHAHLEDHHHQADADADHVATHVEDDDSVVLTLDRVFVQGTVHHAMDVVVVLRENVQRRIVVSPAGYRVEYGGQFESEQSASQWSSCRRCT